MADEGDGVGGVQFHVRAVGQVNQGDDVAVVGRLAAQVAPDHDAAGVHACALEQARQQDALQQALAFAFGDGFGELEAFVQAEVGELGLDHPMQGGAEGTDFRSLLRRGVEAGEFLPLRRRQGHHAVGLPESGARSTQR